MDITGRKLFVKALQEEGVTTLFGYPGGTVTDLFDELYKHLDKIEMGYTADEVADPKDMETYYSKEEQEKYGVLGIKIKVKNRR